MVRLLILLGINIFIMTGCKTSGHYKNPVIFSGADPWIVKQNGFYYYCCSMDNGIGISKSKNLHQINPPKQIWKAPDGNKWNSSCIWAPELHYLNNKWYIYYAGGYGGPPFIHQRTGVLESMTDDPMGEYIDKGMIFTGDNPTDLENSIWAIDMTVFYYNEVLYAVWSGWDKNEKTDKTSQNLYIARMDNPWTISSSRVKISSPDRYYEQGELPLNEGPEVLMHNGNGFIIYSCGQSWLDKYKFAYLKLKKDGDPLLRESWVKGESPIFEGTEDVYGVGHACFTTSPDDKENYILYHSKKDKVPGWNRDIRLQKFTFDKKGMPYFGKPESLNKVLALPSGTK